MLSDYPSCLPLAVLSVNTFFLKNRLQSDGKSFSGLPITYYIPELETADFQPLTGVPCSMDHALTVLSSFPFFISIQISYFSWPVSSSLKVMNLKITSLKVQLSSFSHWFLVKNHVQTKRK